MLHPATVIPTWAEPWAARVSASLSQPPVPSTAQKAGGRNRPGLAAQNLDMTSIGQQVELLWTHRPREQTGVARGWGCRRAGLGAWGEQTHTRVYGMEKQEGPVINRNGKEYKKECIYVYITQSLWCTAEINITL